MTEADWLTEPDFTAHVRFVADRLSPRRQRLLAAGFCRTVEHLFDHPDLNEALAVVEWYADGKDSVAELEKARQRCRELAAEAYEAYVRQVDGGAIGIEGDLRHELAWAVSFAARNLLPVDTIEEAGRRARRWPFRRRPGRPSWCPWRRPRSTKRPPSKRG